MTVSRRTFLVGATALGAALSSAIGPVGPAAAATVIDVRDRFASQPNQAIAGRVPSSGNHVWEAILDNKGNPGIVDGRLINRTPNTAMYAALRSEDLVARVEATVILTPGEPNSAGFGLHMWCHRDKSGKVAAHLRFDRTSWGFRNADVSACRPLSPMATNPKGSYPALPQGVPLKWVVAYSGNTITVTLPAQIGGGTIIAGDPRIAAMGWPVGDTDHTPTTRYCVFEIAGNTSTARFARAAVYGLTKGQ